MTADQWVKRPMQVTVHNYCEECKMLKPDVKERERSWPTLKLTCCEKCFDRRHEEKQREPK